MSVDKTKPSAVSVEADEDESYDTEPAVVAEESTTTPAAPAVNKALLHQFQISSDIPKSQCGICSYLNPAIDGIILKKQRVRVLDDEGKPIDRSWVWGQVKVRAITPKPCAPHKNANCPARAVKMVVGVNVEALAKRYLRAEAVDEYATMGDISLQLAEIDEDLRAEYKTVLARLRLEAQHEHPTS